MASFGENLRREREMRGVTLQEISAATKISVRFLQALEDEGFAKLPGGIFSRSFVRAYARYLGLDEETVLAEYQLVAQPKGDVDLSRLTISKPMPPRETSRGRLVALLVAAAMLGGGYALFRYSRRAGEMRVNVPNPVQVSVAPSPAASQSQPSSTPVPVTSLAPTIPPAGSTTGPEPGGPSTPKAVKPPPAQSGPTLPSLRTAEAEAGLVLQVAATEPAWVAVEADGKTTLQRVLNPNEIQTLKAKESFDVLTGNAQGIILTLNGETLKPLGRRGEVKSIRLTHDDLKNPAP